MRVARNATVHLGSLSSIKGPSGEARYVSWCPASRGRTGRATAGTVSEALADQITCRACWRTAPADALRRAQDTAAQLTAAQQLSHAQPPSCYPIALVAPAAGEAGDPRPAELRDNTFGRRTVQVVYCDSRTAAWVARHRILGPAPASPEATTAP